LNASGSPGGAGSKQNRWIGKDCPVALWAAGLFFVFWNSMERSLSGVRRLVGAIEVSYPVQFHFKIAVLKVISDHSLAV
jgi:hypothetical protein